MRAKSAKGTLQGRPVGRVRGQRPDCSTWRTAATRRGAFRQPPPSHSVLSQLPSRAHWPV